MTIEPAQLVTAVTTGLVLGLAKAFDVLTKRKSTRALARQMDRIEAKVDRVVEDVGELQHRQARVEDRLDIQPSVRRVHLNGVKS